MDHACLSAFFLSVLTCCLSFAAITFHNAELKSHDKLSDFWSGQAFEALFAEFFNPLAKVLDAPAFVQKIRTDDATRKAVVEFDCFFSALIKDHDELCKKFNRPEGTDDDALGARSEEFYKLLTPSDRALGILYYANNYKRWTANGPGQDDDSSEEDEDTGPMDGAGPSAAGKLGKWNRVGGGTRFSHGFSEEGMTFFHSYNYIFSYIKSHHADLEAKMGREAIEVWDTKVHLVPRYKKQSKKRKAASQEDMEPPVAGTLSSMTAGIQSASYFTVPALPPLEEGTSGSIEEDSWGDDIEDGGIEASNATGV